MDLEARHPDIQAMADAAESFCFRWFKAQETGKRLLILSGPSGTGKTHVATRIAGWARAVAFTAWSEARSACPSVPSVTFCEWSNVGVADRMEERDFVRWLADIDGESLLVLDDVGADADRFKSGIHTVRLCDTLNRRAGKFTVITTNVLPEQWGAQWDDRVCDRLLRNSEVVCINAQSFALNRVADEKAFP